MVARHLSKPALARWSIRYGDRCYLVISPEGKVVSRYGSLQHAETARDHAQQRDDAAANRKKRPCLRCQKPFESAGIHNRMCPPCRGLSGDGWDPHSIAPRSGRAR